MKKTVLILAAAFLLISSVSAQYWQQQVDYRIDVSLNDMERTIDGFERMVYTNNSPDTLTYIWIHLWPNAYKNDQTAFSDQSLENGSTKFYFSSKEEKGYINRLDFKVNGIGARTEDHPTHIDIVKLLLPAPLPPNQKAVITTPFHVKLPFNFSRGGYEKHSYQLTQWYPKPAVYDAKGWHPMPYLDQGEFYSEFGNYDVRITVPQNFVVASTGVLQNKDEKNWLLTRHSMTERMPEKKSKAATKKKAAGTYKRPGLNKKKEPQKEMPVVNTPSKDTIKTKTLQFLQNNVHDFALFTSPEFIVNYDTCRLSSGKVIDVYTYYTPARQETWKGSVQLAKDAVRFYSNEVGEYPYDVVSAVQGPQSFGGGMEYPTITVIAPVSDKKILDITLAHEIGHNWFYGILGSNERAYPWMDEGVNSFYENKYNEQKYGTQHQFENILLHTKAVQKTDQPIHTHSEAFSLTNYALVAYHKTAKWLELIEKELGAEKFRQVMQQYYELWKFRHPQPDDFRHALEPALQEKTETYFSLLYGKGKLPGKPVKNWRIATPVNLPAYFKNPSKNLLLLSPAIGRNAYDGFMVGGLITNYKLPPSKFQFLLAPLYGTGSKEWNGLGKLSYAIHSDKKIRRTELFVNGAAFSMDGYTDSLGNQYFTRFQKLVPGIRLTLNEKNPRSTVRKYVQWKSFFIREGGFRFGTDTVVDGSDTSLKQSVIVRKESRLVNQLSLTYENTRALYPFDVLLVIDQVKSLLRPTITVNSFFNYPKAGGLNVRLFAGKLIYLNGYSQSKSFSTDRYHLNMTGPNGYEDYTYSNYFIGRNEFEGLSSQQLMIRDGGFKFRTDLLGNEVGKTDQWLAAVNFNSTIPDKYNPLSILPLKIPLRIFADIGTYGDAWEQDSEEDRFLFDAGLQLSLLGETINIYVPLVYSRVYKDYYKSYLSDKRLLKTISFSINLNGPALKKLRHEVDF